MKTCFHLPTGVTWCDEPPAGLDREAIEQAILSAIERAVARAGRAGAEVVRTERSAPPRQRFDPARADRGRGTYSVPSYDRGGDPTDIPVRGRKAGPREATVTVRWSDDSDDFYDRVVQALVGSSGFRGVRRDEMTAVAGTGSVVKGLHTSVRAFHGRYTSQHSDRKAGQKLKLHVAAAFDPEPGYYTPPLTDIKIAVVDPAAASSKTAATSTSTKAGTTAPPPTAPETPAPPQRPVRREDETPEQRLERHLSEVSRMLGDQLVMAAKQGGNGARFAVEFDGAGLKPLRGDLEGPPVQGSVDCRAAAGKAGFSEVEARTQVRNILDKLVSSGRPGMLDVWFCFARGLDVQKFTITPPAPPPPPPTVGTSPDQQLQDEIDRYRAWYSFAQKTIAAGVAAQDPTKPSNLITNIAIIGAPLAAVKVAKSVHLIEDTAGLVKVAPQAERATDLAKDIRKSQIIQRSEALRLEAKYAGRSSTRYPPETWDYIEQLERAHPGLAAAELRPIKRPAIADPWVFNERMQTSQGKYSFQGVLGREKIQLDDIALDGWITEVKYRDRLHWGDIPKFKDQLRRHAEFARENSLPGVRWECNTAETVDALWEIIRVDSTLKSKIVPVLVP